MRSVSIDTAPKLSTLVRAPTGLVTAVAVPIAVINFKLAYPAMIRCGYFINCQHDASATVVNCYRNLYIDTTGLCGATEFGYGGAAYSHVVSSGEFPVRLGVGTHQLALQVSAAVASIWNVTEAHIYAAEV